MSLITELERVSREASEEIADMVNDNGGEECADFQPEVIYGIIIRKLMSVTLEIK